MRSSPSESLAAFCQSLYEAAAWCRPKIDVTNPQGCLRSQELQPHSTDEPASNDAVERGTWATNLFRILSRRFASLIPRVPISEMGYTECQAVVDRVVEKRALLLKDWDIARGPVNGRLVCCDVAFSEASEASLLETNGYFNEWDVVPWDTWVAWFPYPDAVQQSNGRLIAWVPPDLCELVNRGVTVNPVDCVYWADEMRPSDSFVTPEKFLSPLPNWYVEHFVCPKRGKKPLIQ